MHLRKVVLRVATPIIALMPRMHTTAIVDPQVRLADDVSIGPGCVIEGPVEIGPRTRLMHRVSLRGPLVIGPDNLLYPNVCLGYEPQHRDFDTSHEGPGVVIGAENVLREGVTIHRATGEHPTCLGDRNYLMANAHMGHDCRVGNDCTLANSSLLGGHVRFDDQVITGGNGGIHQFCRVGRLAMISGGASMSQDVPPFCVCYRTRCIGSLNVIGLRRAGLRGHLPPLRRAFNLFFRESHAAPRALELIEAGSGDDPLVREFVAFIRGSQRGITSYGGSQSGQSG